MHSISDAYTALIMRIGTRLGLPRVCAVYLPPEEPTVANRPEFVALELEDGSVGFSYVRIGEAERVLRTRIGAGEFSGADVMTLARGFGDSDAAAKVLGLAAINALSQQLLSRSNWLPPEAADSLAEVAPQTGEHIGMIGFFSRLIPRVRQKRARLTVLELKSELVRETGDFRVTLDAADLASCVKVLSTCTVMLNDTLDSVLSACGNANHFAIIGPTAGCIPDPLFARGIDTVGGRRVVDAQGFRDAFCAGRKWGSFTSKYVIARKDYPGIDWLLERAG